MGYLPSSWWTLPPDEHGVGIYTQWHLVTKNISAGDALAMNSSSWWLPALASSAGAMPAYGIAMHNIQSGLTGYVLNLGVWRCDNWPTFVPPLPLFVNTSAGRITQSAPTATGNKVQVIGVAFFTKTLFFNPLPILGEIT